MKFFNKNFCNLFVMCLIQLLVGFSVKADTSGQDYACDTTESRRQDGIIQYFPEDIIQRVADNSSKKAMKILIVVKFFPKLSETFVMNQVTGLLDLGHDVYVYAEKRESVDKVHDNVIKYNLLERTYYGILPPDLETFDVAVCQFGTRGIKFLDIKKQYNLNTKLVTFFRGGDISTYVYKNPECYTELFKEGDCFLTNCNFFKKRLLKLGAPFSTTHIYYSSIDCCLFPYAKRKKNADKTFHLVTTGRLVEKKGIESALMALQKVVCVNPNVDYTIIGSGRLKEKLVALSRELGIKQHVKFVGWKTQNEIARIMKKCHVFLLPSVQAKDMNEDAIPNTLKEAWSCGLPAICTSHGGIPEVLINGRNGYLVKENDPEMLAERILYLIDHPELWNILGAKGRRCVEKKFELQRQSLKLESILYKVIGK